MCRLIATVTSPACRHFNPPVARATLADRNTAGFALINFVGTSNNPAHGYFTVLPPPLASQRIVQATLLNVLGQVMLTRAIDLTAAGVTADFSTRHLAKGVYVLRLQYGIQVLRHYLVTE